MYSVRRNGNGNIPRNLFVYPFHFVCHKTRSRSRGNWEMIRTSIHTTDGNQITVFSHSKPNIKCSMQCGNHRLASQAYEIIIITFFSPSRYVCKSTDEHLTVQIDNKLNYSCAFKPNAGTRDARSRSPPKPLWQSFVLEIALERIAAAPIPKILISNN